MGGSVGRGNRRKEERMEADNGKREQESERGGQRRVRKQARQLSRLPPPLSVPLSLLPFSVP